MTGTQHRICVAIKKIEADTARNDVCRAYERSNKSACAWANAEIEFEFLIREIYPLEAADNPMWK